MTAGRSRLLSAISISAVVAATALSGTGSASASSSAPRLAAAPVPITHSNGLIAYTCKNENGLSTRIGWVLSNLSGPVKSEAWQYGSFGTYPDFDGGVEWAPDGSEMVHSAAGTVAGWGRVTPQTVFLSEAQDDRPNNPPLEESYDYPWQDTYYGTTGGSPDTGETFSYLAHNVFFTRNNQIYEIPAAGSSQPSLLTGLPAGANSQPTQSPTGDIAFVNIASTGPNAGQQWVWIIPLSTGVPVALGAGYEPKFSPDGTMIAFRDQPTGLIHTMATDGSGVAAAGPTSLAASMKDYAWAPDGTEFVISVNVGNGQVGTASVTAGSAFTAIPTQASCLNLGIQVSWQPVPTSGHEDQVVRVWGSTRQDTSVATSKAGFPTDGSADAVVLADSYHFPDALSGAPLATYVNGPMLLTPGSQTTVWPSVLTEIGRALGSTAKPIYILGGTGSVSQADENQLTALGYTVHRIWGANRYLTALAIANFMGSGATAPEEILLATGTNFPDGLSAGAAAASYWPDGGPGGAVLLTNGSTMVPQVKAYIDAALAAQTPTHHVYVSTVGGLADKAYAGTLSNPKISIVGADRYETSAFVAEVHFGATSDAAVATGTSFPDALSGGAYAGAINAPLLLLPPQLTTSAYEFGEVPYFLNIASGAIATAYVFGGTGVISGGQATQLSQIIGINTKSSQITPTTALSAKSRALSHPDEASKQPAVPTPVSIADAR
jgi:hypothetical protein